VNLPVNQVIVPIVSVAKKTRRNREFLVKNKVLVRHLSLTFKKFYWNKSIWVLQYLAVKISLLNEGVSLIALYNGAIKISTLNLS